LDQSKTSDSGASKKKKKIRLFFQIAPREEEDTFLYILLRHIPLFELARA
jgi:hypothetical protein